MISLVPVSRFRITYEVAAGRPFSQLERMILSAIQQGTTGLDGLQEIFHVHPRLLIEGLVTLTQAGWLAVGGSGRAGFVLTSEGREAAGSDRSPSTTAVSSRRAFVVMERLTGELISNDELRFATKRDLERVWQEICRLRPEVSDNRLDEGQVQHLLPRRKGEWVRWIGPIDMVSKDAHWLPVNVDLAAGTVVGLPDTWLARLRPAIIEGTSVLAASLTEEAKIRAWPVAGPRRSRSMPVDVVDPDALRVPPVGWQTTLSEDDFQFTDDDHEQLLSTVLEEADGSVFVASAFACGEKLKALRPRIEAALQRGVSVDLLWGDVADGKADGRETVNWLRKIADGAKRDGLIGVLRFNRAPSGSHAKLLLWEGSFGVRACVGSYNWLSTLVSGRTSDRPRNISLQISEPAANAALARCAAALWLGAESEVLTSTGDRWRRIASNLDEMASRSERATGNAGIRLILDREHEVLLREWLRTAQRRLLVASQRLGPISESRLVGAEMDRDGDFSFDVLYGRLEPGGLWHEKVAERIGGSGGALWQVPEFQAEAVVSDVSACVTSYGFLSADSTTTTKNARELGIAIDGAEPAEWIWSRLCANL